MVTTKSSKTVKSSKSSKTSQLPTKAEILDFIQTSPSRIGKREIARAFQIKGAARIQLKKLIKEMKEEGLITKPGKDISGTEDLPPVGVVIIEGLTEDGEPYGVPANWESKSEPPKILILPSSQGSAPGMGARLLARLKKNMTDGGLVYEAKIIRELENDSTRALGIFRRSPDGSGLVEPIDKKARKNFIIAKGDDNDAKDGALVEVELKKVRARGFHGLKPAIIRRKLGDLTDPRSICMLAIHQFGIPHKFPEKALKEARTATPSECEREDMRHIDFVTIDPVDAKDHDDAVWAGPDETPGNAGGHIIIVAIADVAAFVRPGTLLDKCALERGNSVYFPGYVEPMLPEELSNGECSLVENEDRPAFAVIMRFTQKGEKIDHRFTRILMRSRAKLSYSAAQAAIDGVSHDDSDKTAPYLESVLKPLWAAYAALASATDKRAPLALEMPERRIALDETGKVERIYVPERFDAHKLIEEMMIQANVAAAETLEKKRQNLIYRVHEQPSLEKVSALADFMKTFDLKLALGGRLTPSLFNGLLGRVIDTDLSPLVSQAVLRAQSQAAYDPKNKGHFGLNLSHYAHFTSPIRRYADLIVHRALITALDLGPDGLSEKDGNGLEQIAEHISSTERTAMAAERATSDRLLALYLSDQIGGEFQAVISGVTKAGLFVELAETGADGFCPARFLGTEYYVFDEKKRALIGEQTGHTYRLGHNVTVKLIEAAPVAGALRFEVLSGGEKGKKPSGRRGAPRGKAKHRKKHKSRKRKK